MLVEKIASHSIPLITFISLHSISSTRSTTSHYIRYFQRDLRQPIDIRSPKMKLTKRKAPRFQQDTESLNHIKNMGKFVTVIIFLLN